MVRILNNREKYNKYNNRESNVIFDIEVCIIRFVIVCFDIFQQQAVPFCYIWEAWLTNIFTHSDILINYTNTRMKLEFIGTILYTLIPVLKTIKILYITFYVMFIH